MRGKVITALAYPIVLAVVALGVVTALMMFVVPQVVEQFDTMGQQLPLLTRMVIGVSHLMRYWWLAAGARASSAGGLIGAALLRNPAIRLRSTRGCCACRCSAG